MTADQLRERFPNASEQFIRANASDYAVRAVSHPKSKHLKAPALGATAPRTAPSVQRAVVRFVGFRVRPLDPDNFAGSVKDLLDGLRHAALISGDEPWRIRLETEQVKVPSFKNERTEIVIERLP